eukprot:COSAG06_NODE_548_length_14433_cov_15.096623_8_plen_144_part_00
MCIDPASAATITLVLAYSARTFPLDCEVYLERFSLCYSSPYIILVSPQYIAQQPPPVRNGNDDRSRSGREFRSAITSFGTLTAAVANLAAPADPRPQGRLRGAQTGQKRAKTRGKEIDLPKKSYASAGAAQRSCLRLTHGGCN